MTYNIVRDIRRDAFERIEHLPLSYIDSHSHGDMVSRIIADVDTFADGLLMGFTQLFTGLATIIGTLLYCKKDVFHVSAADADERRTDSAD